MPGNGGKGVARIFQGVNTTDTDWMDDGNCKGRTDDFYPAEAIKVPKEIKAVCGMCKVRDKCLDFALANREPDGIWGGLNMRQRQAVRKLRDKTA